MRKKRTIGIILFVSGILLKELSYIINIWKIHFFVSAFATIIGSIGLIMAIKAMIYLNNQKIDSKSEDGSKSGDKSEDGSSS